MALCTMICVSKSKWNSLQTLVAVRSYASQTYWFWELPNCLLPPEMSGLHRGVQKGGMSLPENLPNVEMDLSDPCLQGLSQHPVFPIGFSIDLAVWVYLETEIHCYRAFGSSVHRLLKLWFPVSGAWQNVCTQWMTAHRFTFFCKECACLCTYVYKCPGGYCVYEGVSVCIYI